ncbi:MAG: ribulose-phosphate 3-epimerase [Candidatus Aminicenantes bacterium]|nr:ribulose-phosphate 3-epimerase [Candidatus Aminicenantes bacterium]
MNPIFPSILSTNFFDLHAKLSAFAANRIDFIHLDIMDGHFVDNISFGPAIARALKEKFSFRLDAHLMVSNPARMVPRFIESLLMSVFPGYGGQRFIMATLERVRQLKRQLRSQQSPCLLQVDGGISAENVSLLKEAGADLFVIGTHLFNAENIEEKIGQLLKRLQWSQK